MAGIIKAVLCLQHQRVPPNIHCEQLNPELEPLLVNGLLGSVVREVACGSMHTAVVCDDGTLHTFGRGSEGQLGLDLSRVVQADGGPCRWLRGGRQSLLGIRALMTAS